MKRSERATALMEGLPSMTLLLCLAALPLAASVEAPSFDRPNTNYRVYFNDVDTPVVHNDCQAGGYKCKHRGANNIASVTMQDAAGGSYVPITVTVEKLSYDSSVDGLGWNIRPSHLQEDGIVTNVNTSLLSTSGSISFIVTSPCQLSVELGSEDILFASKNSYWAFSNLIVAINPPVSSWPQIKPSLVVDPVSGSMHCTSPISTRSCILAHADDNCGAWDIPSKTDVLFTSSVNRSFRWGDGCGAAPKVIRLGSWSRIFMDDDVVIFARVVSTASGAGIFGYGVISNFYMQGVKNSWVASNLVNLKKQSRIVGPILMDSTYRNIKVLQNSIVEWTKSFAWESETDGMEVDGIDCTVRNNFFKVNDDVLKAYEPHTTFEDNVIWHQTVGRALILSWGNPGENQVDRDSTTQIVRTSIIHDYSKFAYSGWNSAHPEVLSRQANLVLYPALISVQHSMDNEIGLTESAILIRDLHVEGPVGVLMAMTTGYWQLAGKASWQSSNGCGGSLDVHFENLDLRRVVSYASDSAVGGCDQDYSYSGIENAVCLCTTTCGGIGCHVELELDNVMDSEVFGVPRLADRFHAGANTNVQGLSSPLLI